MDEWNENMMIFTKLRHCLFTGPIRRLRFWIFVLIICSFCTVVHAEDVNRGSMAVLPFQIHSLKPLGDLHEGLQTMLSARMGEMGFRMVNPRIVNLTPQAFSKSTETKKLARLGIDLDVRWIIAGSLTQIGTKASIDLKVVNVLGEQPPFNVYVVSDDIDEMSGTMRRLAVSVDDRVTGVPQIDSIYVRGNTRIEKAAVLATINSQPGDRLDYGKLDNDLRNIYKMGFFNDVKMETESGPTGMVVTFRVVEKPSIGKIVFSGNDEIDDEDLQEELGINLYSILDNSEIRQSVNRIRETYKDKGYYNATVEETTEPLPNNEVMLKYTIDEKDKVYIEEIQFVGNTHFTGKQLRKIMETSTKWFLSWITKAGVLDEKMLEFDIHKLTSFYHNQGYIKAKVGEPKVAYDEALKGLVVTIEVDEGPQYSVGKVAVEGELIKPADELLLRTNIGKSDVFNREIVRNDILSLKDVYADEGFAYAEVRPIVKEDGEKHKAQITYDISKGPKVRFERITISGNTHTRDKVIRRELKVIEGEYFSGRKLKRSTANLQRLGFFEDVQVKTKKGSRPDLMKLDIDVKEKGTRTFSVGAGYSAEYSGFVMFQVADENFFGFGQKLQATARLGGKNTEFDIRFVEPWLFDKPLALGVDAYKFSQEYDQYSRDSLGMAMSLGFPLIFDYTRGNVRYGYDDANISDVAAGASQSLKDMTGRNVTSSMTFTVKRDSRDKMWNTSRGSINEGLIQFAGLGGDENFIKYRARTAWFFPMFWNTVFMVQGRWGYIQDRGKLSVFQKFFLGGINTVRGFDYNTISPVDPVTGDYLGGTKMMCYNVEYTFPLLKEQGVTGLVFIDAGNVFAEDQSWTFSGIRKAAGGGIRWYSPIGPLRLEYGFNLDPQGNESSGKFEFSVGGLM